MTKIKIKIQKRKYEFSGHFHENMRSFPLYARPPAAIIKQLNNAEDNSPTVGELQIYATVLHRDRDATLTVQ